MTQKWLCTECGWVGYDEELLRAANPFDKDEEIAGCPRCKAIGAIGSCCDEPNCSRPSTCGTPTKDGYRHTCGKHRPLGATSGVIEE